MTVSFGPQAQPREGQGLLLHSDWEGRVGPVWLSQPFSYPQEPINHPHPQPLSLPRAGLGAGWGAAAAWWALGQDWGVCIAWCPHPRVVTWESLAS